MDLNAIQECGQSVWLDYIRRHLLRSGEFARLVQDDGIRGVTSNPSIFEKAIAGSTDYAPDLERSEHLTDKTASALYEHLAIADIQQAADILHPELRFGAVRVDAHSDGRDVEVELFLGDLDPTSVRVEIYADGINGGTPVREEMTPTKTQPDASRGTVYRATVPTARPASDYTTRAIPRRSGLSIPLESAHILWQR